MSRAKMVENTRTGVGQVFSGIKLYCHVTSKLSSRLCFSKDYIRPLCCEGRGNYLEFFAIRVYFVYSSFNFL